VSTFFIRDTCVERIGRGLLDRSLPKAEWTHAAHFAAVVWLLRTRGEAVVAFEMPNWIRAYNEASGVVNSDTSGYHETITIASIRAACAVLAAQDPALSLHEAVNRLLATELGRSDWLLRYWSRSRLFSTDARRRWMDPDLQPLRDLLT
jgi:hypothetical protein